MTICTMNGSAQDAGSGLETWGQLLAALERGNGPGRPVVTAVRFAGVDQPTFREPAVLAVDLSAAEPVDVDASSFEDIVASARQAARNGLETLTVTARSAARAFRLHDLPSAHRGLGDFVTTFRLLAALTDTVSLANEPLGDHALDAQGAHLLAQLVASLESLLAFNENEDWISVADVLEYEIADTLPRWTTLMNRAEGQTQ